MPRPTPNLQYMDREIFYRNYWNYYLTLESKVLDASNYVYIHEDNFKSYSNEFASLQYSIGAELDSFFKVYCGYHNTDETNIADYANCILGGRYNDIVNQVIELRMYEVVLQPYKGWDANHARQSLPWWLAYDNVKHSRYSNMKDANLKNVLNMIGGLFILEMKYLKELADVNMKIDCPDNSSNLFEMKNWTTRFHTSQELFYVDD